MSEKAPPSAPGEFLVGRTPEGDGVSAQDGANTPITSEKINNIVNEGPPPAVEKSAPATAKWKLGVERATSSHEHNNILQKRKKWLEDLFATSDPERNANVYQARQNIELVVERNFRKLELGDPKTVLDHKIDIPEMRDRAHRILDSSKVEIAPTNRSLLKVIDEPRDAKDVKALRLIGLALLEQGYENGKQKHFQDLSEKQKRWVRLGEIIGLEAERKILERKMVRPGALTLEQAQAAYKRYEQYARNADIPVVFQERFAGMARWLSESFSIEKARARASTEKVRERPFAQPERTSTSRESVKQPQPTRPEMRPTPQAPAASEPGHFSPELETAIEKSLPPESDPDSIEVRRFWHTYNEQLDHAEYITDPDLLSRVTVWTERFFNRPFLHLKVFGFKGLVRSVAAPHRADRAMARVRTKMIHTLTRAAKAVGDSSVYKETRVLAQANVVENRRLYLFSGIDDIPDWWDKRSQLGSPENEPSVEREVEGVIEEPIAEAQLVEGIDMVEVRPGEWMSSSDKEASLRTDIEAWQSANPNSTYAEWTRKMEKIDKQAQVLFLEKAQELGRTPEQLWYAWKSEAQDRRAA